MTVVFLTGCAKLVYADFDRPGPVGKQKITSIIIVIAIKIYARSTLFLKYLFRYTLYISKGSTYFVCIQMNNVGLDHSIIVIKYHIFLRKI